MIGVITLFVVPPLSTTTSIPLPVFALPVAFPASLLSGDSDFIRTFEYIHLRRPVSTLTGIVIKFNIIQNTNVDLIEEMFHLLFLFKDSKTLKISLLYHFADHNFPESPLLLHSTYYNCRIAGICPAYSDS